MFRYCRRIYEARYFWWNLTLADLRFKYRRSNLGIFWSIFQPLLLTLLLSFVMSRFFSMEMHEFAPYIFSGMIIWEAFLGSIMTGCNALTNAGSYILSFNHPMAIYPLRSVLAVFVNFGYAMGGLLIWCMIALPEYISFSYLVLPLAGLMLFLWSWSSAVICSFWGIRFRDLPQFLVLIMQALWYVSPVFFPLQLFHGGKLNGLLDYNPVYHLLELFRAPLLHGEFPSWGHWEWSLGTAVILWLLAILTIRVCERKTIYYV